MQALELSATPVSLEPRNVYGIRVEVDGNIHFNLNQEVIYPVEGVIVFHDYLKKKQRFLKLPPYAAPTIICQNANRTLLGVVEQTTREDQEREHTIVIYDLNTSKRQHTLQPPANACKKRIKKIAFTCESNSIVALTEYPEELLIMFQFDRLGSVYEGRAGNTNLRGTAAHMACHPTNEDVVAVCGEGLLKLLLRTEKGFTVTHDIKPELTGTSIAWISPELLFMGTVNASLILYQNGVKVKSFDAKQAELMDLFNGNGTESQDQQPQVPAKNDAVVCMTIFPKGVAYAVFNQVYVFEKVSRTRYERKTILDIPPTLYPEPLYQITNIAINPKQDTIIVTPQHSQIYVGLLIVPESLKTKRLQFKTLGERIHIDGILQVCVCAWRPIVMTISKDTTLRVWNYETGKVEIVKRFGMEINVVALYHTGQNVVVGFKDVVKVMQIYMHDLHTVKQWEYSDTKDIKVSSFGHLLAIGYEKVVVVVSAFSAETFMKNFPTDGSVLALAWARDDKSLFAADDGGAVVEFNVHTGARLQKVHDPTTKHLAISATSVPRCFYATTETGMVRFYEDSTLVGDVKMPVNSPLLAMSVSKSDLIMFVASQRGQLYNIQLPLNAERGGAVTATNFFDTAINQICFSYDGSLLMSCSDSGTLVIWTIKGTEGRLVPIDPDLLRSHEVLIPRKDLADMLNQISNLEMRLKQQAAEFYKKQSQNEENDQQQMADIHKGYCAALAEMQAKSNEIEGRHAAELTQITSQIDELHQKHAEDMSTVATGYSERMQMEYQKFANLREEMLHIRESYDEKLRQSKACLHDTVEALEKDFTEQLTERQELIKQLMKDLDDKKQEFINYCHDTEVDNDRKMINCQIEYEKKVKFERDQVDTWKTNAKGHQRKHDSIVIETKSLVEEVNSLKDKHLQHKAHIAQLRNDITDLHRDVADREQAISVKEKRIDEIQTKNHELEKYKHVLNHKISELKAQIEPRELQIVEKRKQIAEMEHELSGLIKNNQQLDWKLKELRDKVLSVNVELKLEKSRAKSAHLCITDISTDIYRLAGDLHSPEKLKRGLKQLFLKYSNDDALKKFVTIDTQVQAKLNRQRAHIEKIMDGCREKIQAKSSLGKSKKLSTDRKLLQEQVEAIKQQNSNLQNEIVNMNILVKIFAKTKSTPDPKLQDCFVEVERVEKYFEDTMDDMQAEITAIIEENEKLSEQVATKRKLLLLSGM